MKWYTDWIRYQIEDLHVDVKLCTTPELKGLQAYDVVVNATGARSHVPETGVQADRVIPFEQVMACPKVSCEFHPQDGRKPVKLEGSRVIVWGDHYAAVDTVVHLASIGKEVTVVTDRKEFASSVEVIHMYIFRKWFKQTDAEALSSKMFKHPVTVIESRTIDEIGDGEVVLLDRDFNRKRVPCDHVVTCWTRPRTELPGKLKDAGLTVVSIGDALRPRNLHAAVKEGASLGLVLDEHKFFNPNSAFIDEIPIDIAGQLTR
jgi:cation diffusion facilitator CzcD-associated flavoprotein CzcO